MIFVAQLAADHSRQTTLAAAAICVASGWLVAILRDRAAGATGPTRWHWLIGFAVVAGLGVWTTHFMAMIGYRPDLPLGYGSAITTASAVIGIFAIGLPLAAAGLTQRRSIRAALGAAAGLGIGAMHDTGMSALTGCLQSQSLPANLAAYGAGAILMAVGTASRRVATSHGLFCAIFTLAVCATHFVSIAGTTLIPLPGREGAQAETETLGLVIGLGAAVLLIGSLLIIVAVRRFEAQEQAHSSILSAALNNMSNGLVLIDEKGRLGLFNDRLIATFGLGEAGLRIGMTAEEAIDAVAPILGWDAERRRWVTERFALRMLGIEVPAVDYVLPNGRIVEVDSNPVAGGGTVLIFEDVTGERAARDEILEMAFKDMLTGLPNRRAFRERKIASLREHRSFHLLLIDLDRFKAVNDTFGHAAGDALLVQVGRRLTDAVGEEGFVARLGGDEMGAFVEGDEDKAKAIAQRIIESISEPFVIGDVTALIGCSIGLCSGDGFANADDLMQCADIALYEAKRRGKSWASYRTGLLEAVAERRRLEADLRQALPLGQFHLAYQPVLALDQAGIIGYEALLRWTHPVRGLVSPADFIPVAEEIGLIVEIGRWVLEEACREAATWPNERHIAVNVSSAQFRSPLLLSHLTAALSKSGLPAHRLEVELTETALVEDGSRIAQVLSDIRLLGVKVALDDFGTGYSSLTHLCAFPLDRIKIDRSFVATAETDPHARAVVKAVVALGHDIGIPTLAEGIETTEQLELLRGLGCGAVQGYLIGKPAPISDQRSSANVGRYPQAI